MRETNFCTWHAKTLSVLEYIDEIAPLKQRFVDVGINDDSVEDKVKQVRGILLAVVEIINSPLFGTGKVTTSVLPNIGGVVIAPNIAPTQILTQSVNVDLATLLKRVDDVEGVSAENKEKAKPLVKSIWEHVKSGASDNAKLIDLTARLGMLGLNAYMILNGLST